MFLNDVFLCLKTELHNCVDGNIITAVCDHLADFIREPYQQTSSADLSKMVQEKIK